MVQRETVGKLELLAPAGDMECLHAAVSAGADAVYLGAQAFNARRGAGNFSIEGLREACVYGHLRDVRIYLAVNTLILPSEVDRALELVRQAHRRGVDGFIIQDIGLASEVRRILPEASIHVSTQMNVHNVAGLQAAVELGASRVTLARELSLEEVSSLSASARAMGLETEIFGHGALCVCYSGQCLMSSLIGGRSANRGVCAQACRLPYTLHNRALRKTLASPGDHLLSPKDLCTVDILEQIRATGVDSLKIEGRMKSPEYVHAVVGVYREVIDRLEKEVGSLATEDERRVLSEAFSRGFTTGYLTGNTGNDMMSYARPNNRGVLVGRVADAREGSVVVTAERDIERGDILEFWTNKGHFTHVVTHEVRDARGSIRFSLSKRVGRGDRVFRVRQASLAFVDDPLEPRIPIMGRIVLHSGEPMTMDVASGAGLSIHVEGPLVEQARTKAVSEEEVRIHVGRLGGTPFVFSGRDDLEVQIDEGVGVGFSQLHALRKHALEELERLMTYELCPERPLSRMAARTSRPASIKAGCRVAVWATNPACARAAKRAGADVVYISALNYRRGEAMISGQRSGTAEQAGYPKQAVIAMPVIDHDLQGGSREQRFDFDPWSYVKAGKPVLVEGLGQLVRARDMGAEPEIGPHIPVANELALAAAADLGALRAWLSPELSLGQIAEIGASSPIDLGLTAIGSHELMVTEHCLLMSQGPCNQDCGECPRRKSPHFLKDRKGYEIPVVTDCCGRSHLYNAVGFDIAHMAPDIIRAGVSMMMVDATLMNVDETTVAVKRLCRARDIALKSGDAVSKAEGKTTGHIFRGVS